MKRELLLKYNTLNILHSSCSLPHIRFCEYQCNPIIPACLRHAGRVWGQVDGWGNAETDKERKSRSCEEKKSRLRARCGIWGYGATGLYVLQGITDGSQN